MAKKRAAVPLLWPWLWWEMYLASWETIGYRLMGLTLGGFNPGARQQRENHRMITEKVSAAVDTAGVLAGADLAREAMRGWNEWARLSLAAGYDLTRMGENAQRLWWDWPQATVNSAADTMEAAVRPWHRRVTANARRLRKNRGG